ncbi:MAG: amylo-alpha-1,6-glucosidase [Nitrospiraceae bacterium]
MDKKSEWLEADGLGGFASGTVAGIRTRRYHALLWTATTPPTGRLVLVNGFDAWVETPSGTRALSSQAYPPDVIYPDGVHRIQSFEAEPWPRWIFHLEDGTRIAHEVFVPHGHSVVAMSWRLLEPRDGVTLSVRPFFSGRDYHALHHENAAFRFEPRNFEGRLVWHPYEGLPGIVAVSNGEYRQQPEWYRNFLYEEERARGLDFTEDLSSPGVFRWDLSKKEAVWILAAEAVEAKAEGLGLSVSAEVLFKNFRDSEAKRRRQFPTRLHRAADAYLVKRGEGKTIIAGYPWFADWGRDTFISIRGLCLATGRLDAAREILLEWAGTVSEGMLPNRFPDQGDSPEFNSVDASLWYVIAVHEFLQATEAGKRKISPRDRNALQEAIEAILAGYVKGTRYRIHLEEDGLLAAGQPGVQLTWMDAKVGDWVVTPRIGKPVEIQALWLNALKIGSGFSDRWNDVFVRGCETFRARFWNPAGKYLHDVVDADHEPGKVDPSFRPNQIFAVGGLPFPLLDGERARAVVEAVEARLWTPIGLRSLAPGEPGYAPRYQGGVRERDGAYHQGTVWPWLLGAFVEAWVRVRGSTLKAKRDAGVRYLDPLLRHLDEAGLGHISEIADADPPHTPRGCPFQAWSVGEALRLALVVLGDEQQLPPRKKA